MTDSKSKLTTGEIEIALDGHKKTLKPTLGAALAVSRVAGGITGAIRAVEALDLDIITLVVRAGLDLTPRGAEGLEEKVFKSGVGFKGGLAGPVLEFLHILANGGQPREVEGSTDDAGHPQQEAESA